MNRYYEHNQIGYFMIGAIFILVGVTGWLVFARGFSWSALAGVLACLIILAIFSSLKTVIEEETLILSFGLGIIRKKFLLRDIQYCQVVKYPWYYGWGIHLTPNGWIYNVSGFHAVQITMKTGQKYLIGTDVPGELAKAIESAVSYLAQK